MTLICGVMREGLLLATESADGWTSTLHFAGQHVESVAVSPGLKERIFCGTFGDGLYRSQDGGETFDRIGEDTLESDQITAIAIDPDDSDVVWAGTEPSDVYRSADGGDTWQHRPGITELPSADDWWFPPRPDSHRVRCIQPDPEDSERLLIGIELGAFVVTPDGGATWTEDVPGARDDTHQIAVHPTQSDRLYAASGFGYAESRDGGESWTQPQSGLEEAYHHLWSVAPDPGDPDRVLASTSEDAFAAHFDPPEAYLHRRNGEDGWERVDDSGLPTGDGVFATSLAPGHEHGEFFALNNTGLYRSTDGGDSWEPLDVEWPDEFGEQDPRGLRVV